jgi:hypothetical protein
MYIYAYMNVFMCIDAYIYLIDIRIFVYIYTYVCIYIGISSTPYTVDEDPNECPVCKFIKGGECKDFFVPWDECMKSANDNDFASKCFKVRIYMCI